MENIKITIFKMRELNHFEGSMPSNLSIRLRRPGPGYLVLFILLVLLTWSHARAEKRAREMVPGDELRIEIPQDQKSSGKYVLNEDSKIEFPFGDALSCKGVSDKQVTGHIRTYLEKYFKEPEVIEIFITRKLSRFQVNGQVNKPGWYSLPSTAGIQQLISQAGYFREGALLDKIMVVRPGKESTPDIINYQELMNEGSDALTRSLPSGSKVFVPMSPVLGNIHRTLLPYEAPAPEGRKNIVNILGQIENPGAYEIKREINILDLITMAGGPQIPRNTSLTTDLENILIVRTENDSAVTRKFNMNEFFRTGNAGLLLKLRAGDNVMVPTKKMNVETKSNMVAVFGAVKLPSTYEISGTISLVHLLTRAGSFFYEGTLCLADRKAIQIISLDSNGLGAEIKKFDFDRFAENPKNYPSPLLKPNDILIVPFASNDNIIAARDTHKASVFGEVHKPGEVDLAGNTDIYQALAKAGGPRLETASLTVHITRKTEKGPVSMNFDLRDGSEKIENPAECSQIHCNQGIPYVRPGDVIWVERKRGLALKWWIDLAWKVALFGIFLETSLNLAGAS